MDTHPLHQLRKRTDTLSAGDNIQDAIVDLSEAFLLFSQETTRLETAYSKLQEDLKAVNSQLHHKVVELDLLSHYLSNILKHMNQGLIFIDMGGTIITYNSAAELILEKQAKEVLLQPYNEHFDDSLFGFSLKKTLEDGKDPSLNFVRFKQKELEIGATLIRQGTKGLIILVRDITEMRWLQKQAALSDRLKELGEMAASLAHEIRNPLGGIEGYASLLQRDLLEKPKLCQMADYILQGARSLSRLVENVLHYTRPVQAQLQIRDLRTTVAHTCALWQADLSFPKEIEVTTDLGDEPLLAPFDIALFQSALLNLLRNARESLPQGGKIEIALQQKEDRALLTIRDSGTGIDPENIPKLFSPFFTTKEEGTGLGLVEVYKIIQSHLGTIDVQSTLGSGTTFTIQLPRKNSCT